MRKLVTWAAIVLLIGCSENPSNPVVNDAPVIESLKMSEYWSLVNTEKLYPVEIKVTDKQGPQDILSVKLEVENSGTTFFSGSLFDDGGISGSSDVLAGDGVFKNVFHSNEISTIEGDYTFKFIVTDSDFNEDSLSFTSIFSLNSPPEIKSVSVPDSFPGNSGTLSIFVSIYDLDEDFENDSLFMDVLKDNNSVLLTPYKFANDGNSENGDLTADDSLYALKLDSSFSVDKKGEYEIQFFARDQFGIETERISRNFYIQNLEPVVTYINMPSSVLKPVSPDVIEKVPIKITVNDPQSPRDISRVYFELKASDGNYIESSPGVRLQEDLFDDGDLESHGDDILNDAVYSVILAVNNSNQPDSYTFEFYAVDKVGNISSPATFNFEIKDTIED